MQCHDDVIKWKHFPRYWPFVQGILRSPVNSPHKNRWRVALMFSLICAWTNGWVNHRDAGHLRRDRAHYDVTVMAQMTNQRNVSPSSDMPTCDNLAFLSSFSSRSFSSISSMISLSVAVLLTCASFWMDFALSAAKLNSINITSSAIFEVAMKTTLIIRKHNTRFLICYNPRESMIFNLTDINNLTALPHQYDFKIPAECLAMTGAILVLSD